MDAMYVCNKEIRRTNMLEDILSRTFSTNSIDPFVENISTYSEIVHELVNSIFLLLDNKKKIMVFK